MVALLENVDVMTPDDCTCYSAQWYITCKLLEGQNNVLVEFTQDEHVLEEPHKSSSV